MVIIPMWQAKLKKGVLVGLREGWDSFIWLIKIIIPVSLLVALIQWSGLIYRIDFLLRPLMKLINLPGEAAIPIISGFLINIYATIATMMVLNFSLEQMTLIAVFSMVAHSLIPECIIQRRCGTSALKMTLFRFGAATLAVLFMSLFFGDATGSASLPAETLKSEPLFNALKAWGIDTVRLLVKIAVILILIMVVFEVMREMRWTQHIVRAMKPLMKVMGLSDRTAMLWLTASIFGLTYGGAVIIEEVRTGLVSRDELERLHISIGINHSVVEDPALLLAIGISPLWLWLPRFALAVLAVQGYRLVKRLMRTATRGVAAGRE